MSKNLNQPDQFRNDPFFTGELPELRSGDGGVQTVFGYWAVFGQRSRVLRTRKGVRFQEVILPGAFDDTDFSDVESHFNHRNYLSSEPSLRHGVDVRGAWYEFPIDPVDPEHVALVQRMNRGEVKGSSFQFPPPPSENYRVVQEGDLKVVYHDRISRVVEFGPVIAPAYSGTSSVMRSLDSEDSEDLFVEDSGKDLSIVWQRRREAEVLLATHSIF